MSFYRLLIAGCLLLSSLTACAPEQPTNLQPFVVEPTAEPEEAATATQAPQIENTLAPVVVYDIATETLPATAAPQPTDTPTIEPTVEPTEASTIEPVAEQPTETVPTPRG